MSSSSWVAPKALPLPEQSQEFKVHLRENPLTSVTYASENGKANVLSGTATPTPQQLSVTAHTVASDPVTELLVKKKGNTNPHGTIGHPSRLNRGMVKADVLKTFTTNQPIASFIDVDEGLSEDKKAKMLAERLSSTTEATAGQRVTGNSQVELVSHVEGLDKELRRFWKGGEKVRSTRVTIQAIKMLCNPKVPQCYPSIFMLVSSVMDTFGDFVAKRLQELSANGNAVVATLLKKGQDADADLIPAEAVEVCNNWFLKISSIRELVPRICVELSLLKCFRYVSKKMRSAMPEVVERLAGQIRGVADPLVAAHIRWYLFLRAQEVLVGNEWAKPLTQCYLDQLQMMTSVKYPGALSLYAPSVQWMLDTLLKSGSVDDRELVIEKSVEHIFSFRNADLTAVLFRALPFADLATIGMDNILAHISAFKDHQERAVAVSAFCMALVDGEVPGASRGAKTAFLSEIHGVAELETMPVPQFMMITESLLMLCSAHFGPKQIHVMLRLMREKIVDEPQTTIEAPLAATIARLIHHFSPGPLLTSADLVPLVRLVSISGRGQIITNLLRAIPFGNEGYATVALELCRILEQCQPVGADSSAYAAVVADTLIAVCPSDAEAKLAFLCEARHTLSDAEPLRAALVHIALRTVEGLQMNTRKRRNIAKVFFAFCHVTIPALQSPFARMKVALLATAVAFKKGLVSYGEGLLHLCVGILPELEPFTTQTDGTVSANDAAARDIALQLLSISAVVPPHQKYGHLYVFETLLQWTDKYQWPISSTTKYTIWLAVLRITTRLLKNELGYGYPLCGTAHNSADPQFIEACNDAALAALKRLLFNLNRLASDSPQHPLLHDVCLEGFETIMKFGAPGKSIVARAAGAFFWKVGKESMSGSITPAMERARSSAGAAPELNEVIYYDHRKDLVFERFGCRLSTEDASAAVGASTGSNAYADDAIPSPAANGPSGPANSSRNFVDPNDSNLGSQAAAAAGGGDDDILDEIAALESGVAEQGAATADADATAKAIEDELDALEGGGGGAGNAEEEDDL